MRNIVCNIFTCNVSFFFLIPLIFKITKTHYDRSDKREEYQQTSNWEEAKKWHIAAIKVKKKRRQN